MFALDSHKSLSVPAKKAGWANADNLGILASAICVVHCVAFPLLALALPALASRFGNDHLTHYVLAGFVVAFCLLAIVPGYRQHRHVYVLSAMVVGVSMVLFATFMADQMLGPWWEMPIITLGNFIVVSAHLRNRKLLAATAQTCC